MPLLCQSELNLEAFPFCEYDVVVKVKICSVRSCSCVESLLFPECVNLEDDKIN